MTCLCCIKLNKVVMIDVCTIYRCVHFMPDCSFMQIFQQSMTRERRKERDLAHTHQQLRQKVYTIVKIQAAGWSLFIFPAHVS